jgi:hypothetical protein
MITLTIRHLTTCCHHQPVWLRPHRLTLRPRESREPRLASSDVKMAPSASLLWEVNALTAAA